MSELPEGWAEVSLGDVIQGFEAGRNLRSSGRPANRNECGVLKISAVTWGSFRPNENKALLPGDQPRPHERVRKGDLLISRANTSDLVGAVVLVEEDHERLMLPDKILRIVPATGATEPRFLVHALRSQSVRNHFSLSATGTSDSMRNLSQPKMAAAPFRLPPLEEQSRIVEKVEALLSDVNAARERLAKVPALLKRFRQSVLAAACSGRLTAELRNDELASGGSLGGWRSVRIGDCVDILDNRRVPVNAEERKKRFGRIPYYGATGQVGWIDDHLFDEQLVLIGEDGAPFLDKSKPIAYIIDGKSWVNNHAHVLRAIAGIATNQFVKYALDATDFHEHVNGTTRLKLTKGAMVEIPLALPPLTEQHEIAHRVDALFALADAIEARVAATTARAGNLAPSILAKAFRGELVPTEAELARRERRDYESALALLGRVRVQRDGLEMRRS